MANIGEKTLKTRDKKAKKWYHSLREILRREPMFLFPSPMKNSLKTLVKRSPFEVATLGAIVALSLFFVLPTAARATADAFVVTRATELEVAAAQNRHKPFGALPVAGLGDPTYTMTVTATAYNSDPAQTDDTPFITASGTHVRQGVLAANFLPIGTLVKIPSHFGDQIFIVEDRMNPRYDKRIDIWMEEGPEARQFGVRTVAIEVYKAK
jgi:3D (Asp-Asp-Asp) domain-containing protein